MYSSGAPTRDSADTTGFMSCGLRMLALKKKNGTDKQQHDDDRVSDAFEGAHRAALSRS